MFVFLVGGRNLASLLGDRFIGGQAFEPKLSLELDLVLLFQELVLQIRAIYLGSVELPHADQNASDRENGSDDPEADIPCPL